MCNDINVENIHPVDGDVILIHFDINKIRCKELDDFCKHLKNCFPSCFIVAVPKDFDLAYKDKKEAITELNRIITNLEKEIK